MQHTGYTVHKAAIYIVKENILFWSVGDWCQLGQELKESDQMTIKTHLVEGCCWGGGVRILVRFAVAVSVSIHLLSC